MMKFLVFFTFSLFFIGCSTVKQQDVGSIKRGSRLIFSTGLSSEDIPVNSLDTISLSEPKLYMYSSWKGLKRNKKYKYKNVIFGSDGFEVSSFYMNFKPNNTTSWNTWSWYDLNKFTDKTDVWSVQVYLSDVLILERKIVVVD